VAIVHHGVFADLSPEALADSLFGVILMQPESEDISRF
jgi:hypothetical protein